MYIYRQKRISPIEQYLPIFTQHHFFFNVHQQLKIILVLQHYNLFFIKNYGI
jgi:hypothetical protein